MSQYILLEKKRIYFLRFLVFQNFLFQVFEWVKKEDKDRFRQGLGGVIEAYEEVSHRLGIDLSDLG